MMSQLNFSLKKKVMKEYLITLVNVCHRSRKSNYKMLYNPYFVKSILNDYICTGKDTG